MTEWPEARLRPSRAGQGKAQALGPTWTQWSHLPLGEFPRASRAEASWVEGSGGWADSAGQGGLGLVRADRDRAPSVRSVPDAGPAQAQLGMWGVGGRCSGDSSWVILMTPVSRAPSPQSTCAESLDWSQQMGLGHTSLPKPASPSGPRVSSGSFDHFTDGKTEAQRGDRPSRATWRAYSQPRCVDFFPHGP